MHLPNNKWGREVRKRAGIAWNSVPDPTLDSSFRDPDTVEFPMSSFGPSQSLSFCLPHVRQSVLLYYRCVVTNLGFPGSSAGKESACNAGDACSVPRSGISPGEGNGNPLHYFCLKSHGQRSMVGYSPWDRERVGHDLAKYHHRQYTEVDCFCMTNLQKTIFKRYIYSSNKIM